jgi:hypothetical protein
MTILSTLKVALISLITAGAVSVRADSISGTFSNDCSGLVKLWDLSGNYESTNSDGTETETIVLTMDATGALTGSGHFDVNDDANGTVLHGDFNASGKVSSAGSATRVKLTFVTTTGTGQVQGRDITFQAKLNDSFELDESSRMLVGNTVGKYKITVPSLGVTKSKSAPSSPVTENLPDNVDGAWGLLIDTAPDSKNKYNGASILHLSNDKIFGLAVTGTYSSNTDLSKISLKSTDKSAPITLSVVEQQVGNSLSIFSIKGKALGQTVQFSQ